MDFTEKDINDYFQNNKNKFKKEYRTIQYLEIVKINNHLEDRSLSEAKRQKYIQAIIRDQNVSLA